MSTKVHLTQTGYEELQGELDQLKTRLPKAIDRVTKAREHGDLSENSEYHAAREDLSFIEGRIEELQDIVDHAKIITETDSNGQVSLGSNVTVNTGKSNVTFTIVGEYEADPTKKKISHDSPLGKALIGKKVDEQVEYQAPVGKVVYKITNIQ